MQHAFLRVDVHLEVAEEVESQESRHLRVGDGVVDGGGEIADFHAADGDRVQICHRRLDQAVGGLEGQGLRVGADVDGEIARQSVGNEGIARPGIDDKLCRAFVVQDRLNDDHLSMSLHRNRGPSLRFLYLVLRRPRCFLYLSPARVAALRWWNVV